MERMERNADDERIKRKRLGSRNQQELEFEHDR